MKLYFRLFILMIFTGGFTCWSMLVHADKGFDNPIHNSVTGFADHSQNITLAQVTKPKKAKTNRNSKSKNAALNVAMDALWEDLRNTSHLVEGEGSKEIFVFFDPYCSHCHRLWKDSREYLTSAKIYWIPVAEMTPESKLIAATLLKSRNIEDLAKWMRIYKCDTTQPDSELQEKIDANAAILKRFEIYTYPAVFYGEGAKREILRGAPEGDELKAIFGSGT